MKNNKDHTDHRTLRLQGLACLLLVTLGFAVPAHAVPEPAPDPVAALTDHVRAKDADAIRRDLEAVAAAYPTVERSADKKRMLRAVGKVLRLRNEDLQSAALEAYEEIGDPDAWRYYDSLLAKPFKEAFPRLASQAMDVTRAITPDAAVSRLLRIARKSKNHHAAAKAIETLGAFRASRHRTRILGEIIAVTRKEKPGVRGRDNTVVYGPRTSGEQARNRWQALARPMVEAANELTGQDLASPGDWFSLWREHKSRPSALFVGE